MSNEERRAEANLMVMCATCHKVIDTDVAKWTVQKLQALKAEHEAIYTGAIDLLRRQVGDITEGVTWASPVTLGGVYKPGEQTAEELAVDIAVIDQLAAKLASMPMGARSVLALVIARGDTRDRDWDVEVTIPMALLSGLADCSEDELIEHLRVIEHMGFGAFEEPFDGQGWQYQLVKSTGDVGWKVFCEIKRLAAGDPKVVRRAIIDLDFTVLDLP
jgi:hypothetical protein